MLHAVSQIVCLFKYQFLIKLLLKIAFKPIMVWMGLEHDYWYQYLNKNLKSLNNLADKEADNVKPLQKKYSRIHQQRWLKVLQVCKTVEF
ncbi:hypothetical protein NIES2101_36645 [Calothrix sp. HK-06]|nr:hypothetical protein NIES2101_36645 [Calothrix sp. HK-06]